MTYNAYQCGVYFNGMAGQTPRPAGDLRRLAQRRIGDPGCPGLPGVVDEVAGAVPVLSGIRSVPELTRDLLHRA